MVTLTYQERFKTFQGVFDEHTERNLFELQSKGIFDELLSPLKIGKESNVFIAVKDNRKIIVKIYRVQNCDFKRMYGYIRQDPRYSYLKHHRRQIIFAWTQREFRNLKYAEKAGINAPKPLAFCDNIIIEEMIGDKDPAPPLKDVYPKNPRKCFDEVITSIKKLYQQGLIHGDLSAFNILIDKEKPYFIDFSQATVVKTPNSQELMQRDIKNMVTFFKKLGVERKAEEIIKEVTA